MDLRHAHPLSGIPAGQLESLEGLMAQFRADGRPEKVDLMCGVYRTEEGQPFVLPSVQKARQRLFAQPKWDHEYPSSHLGEARFRNLSTGLQFVNDKAIVNEGRVASMQCLGASGAVHMGALFLRAHYEPYNVDDGRKVYIPLESWVNHPNVFHAAGFETASLPWYNHSSQSFDLAAFSAAIRDLPPQSIIVLQVCANNPTGCDPSAAQWDHVVTALKSGNHFAFLDLAYAGFVSGSVAHDVLPIHLLIEADIPLLVASTYGKSFGLYGERVGHLCIPLPDSSTAEKAEQQMKLLARAETGAQPRFGAELVSIILENEDLRTVWESDVREIALDLVSRRERLQQALVDEDKLSNWDFITRQSGMFTFTSLTSQEIDRLRDQHAVYLQDSGRLSIAGLNATNIAHVAASIAAVKRKTNG